MLHIDYLHENKEHAIAGLTKRHVHNAVDSIEKILTLDKTRKILQQKRDVLLTELNILSKQIGSLIQQKKLSEAEAVKAKTKELKITSSKFSHDLEATSNELQEQLYRLPNIPHTIVPKGQGGDDNKILFEKKVLPIDGHVIKAHWETVKQYDIIDFELGNKITGAGFPVYKGKGARLQRGLINFFLDKALEQGYKEVQPPILVNEASGYGTGQLPDKEGQMYHVTSENLYLIPTSEVPITNLYRDMIIPKQELPIKNTGYSPCFRREAGSWGSHVRGLNRLHQFDKVEIVQLCKPEESYQALEEMCSYVQGLLEALNLPYRKVLLCGGDLGFAAALTYDLEVYAQGQQRWLEVSSVSNFETFQSNRLKLRYRDDSQTPLLHTLNGSALALPRIVASILENNLCNKGVLIPDVLIPYVGFDKIN